MSNLTPNPIPKKPILIKKDESLIQLDQSDVEDIDEINDQILVYGHYNDSDNIRKINHNLIPRIFRGLKQININQISGGMGHIILLSEQGFVYTVGIGKTGQLGHGPSIKSIKIPKKIEGLNNIIKITTGPLCCAAIEKKNTNTQIFLWGELMNFMNPQFDVKEIEGIEVFKELFLKEKLDPNVTKNAKNISVGLCHIFILTEKGNALVIGGNEKYALGNPNQKSKLFLIEENITKIRTNESNCCALLESGKILHWGTFGTEVFKKPTPIKTGKKYIDVKLGLKHLVCLTAEGQVYCFGLNENWQLGYQSKKKTWKEKAKEIKNIPPIKKISCGNYHSCGLTADGQIFIWGKNVAMGESSTSENTFPTILTTQDSHVVYISKIYCGPDNVYAIVDRKNLPTICYSFFNPPTIQCCTIDALFDCIFDEEHKNTKKYQKILMLTWKDWTTPVELVRALEKKVKMLSLSGEINTTYQIIKKERKSRVTKFIMKWIEKSDYYCWNDEETFQNIASFLSRNFEVLLKKLQTKVSFQEKSVFIPSLKFTQLLAVFEVRTSLFAKYLMDISYQFLESINLFQYFKDQNNYPPVQTWTAHYNNFHSFVVTTILCSIGKQTRQERLNFWCEILKLLIKFNNFTYMSSLHLALDSIKSSELVKKKIVTFSHAQLKDIEIASGFQFNSQTSIQNYRDVLTKLFIAQKPAIPHLGDFNQQLINLEENFKKRVKMHENEPEKQNHINWKYYEKVTDVLFQLEFFRDFRFEEVPNIRKQSDSKIMRKKTLVISPEEDSKKLIFAVKGIGSNIQTKTKILNRIVNNPEEKDTPNYWDEICENGQFESAKHTISITALCAQLNSIAETHFDLGKAEIKKRKSRKASMNSEKFIEINKKIITKIQKWNEDIKSKKEIFVGEETINFSTVINLSSLLENMFKYFLKYHSQESVVMNNTVRTMLKHVLIREESTNFNLMNFFSLFTNLNLPYSEFSSLFGRISDVLCCFKDFSQVISISEKISKDLLSLKDFSVNTSDKDISSFNEKFGIFLGVSKLWRESRVYIDLVHNKLEFCNTKGLMDQLEKEINAISNPLNEKECVIFDPPVQYNLLDKLDIKSNFEQQKLSVLDEIEYLEMKLSIMRSKETLINVKIEREKGLKELIPTFQSLKETFLGCSKTWASQLENFETNQKILNHSFDVFNVLLSNIEKTVKSENVSMKNQMVNKIAKFKADLDRNYISHITDEIVKEKISQNLAKVLELCSSLTENTSTAPRTPVPSLPKLQISLKDLSCFTQQLGVKAVEKLNNGNVLTLKVRKPTTLKEQQEKIQKKLTSITFERPSSELSNEENSSEHGTNSEIESPKGSQHSPKIILKKEETEVEKRSIYNSLKELRDLDIYMPNKRKSKEDKEPEQSEEGSIYDSLNKISDYTPLPEIIIQNYICKIEIESNNDEKLIEMKQGDVFSVIDKTSEWYFGTNQRTGESGYVHSSDLMED